MSRILLIVSDLHLADGHAILDSFGDRQQAAFEGLINAACTNGTGPLGEADNIELVFNGDSFDFLLTAPYDLGGISEISMSLEKLQKIIAAHPAFFKALRRFIETPGRYVTFMTGNHDIELQFETVREFIYVAIGGDLAKERVTFCPARFYRPLPDVYIEHGNHYDFWNHAIHELWNEAGEPLGLNLHSITLPVGSHYLQHAAYPISIRYPYFDCFEPSMKSMRQIALLCLLDPETIVETATLTTQMFSAPYTALVGLAAGEEMIPSRLFEQTMIDFVAFREEMQFRKPDWVEHAGINYEELQTATMIEFNMLREALKLSPLEAVAAISTPTIYQMGEEVAAGMHGVLKSDPALRYAIAGHTHMARIDTVNNGSQYYLNTASWTMRLTLPAPGEVNAALLEWLRRPDWAHMVQGAMNWAPTGMRDVTQFIFAMVQGAQRARMNLAPTEGEGASCASLCVWEGGLKGSYRVLWPGQKE
jgi:UDP-2,3-diacylglucosamine pyrophosphatase LpxH